MMFFSVLIWLLSALFGLVADALNLVLAWLVVFKADDKGNLPGWLSWFQTPGYALDGNQDWQTKYRWFRNHPKVNEGWRRYFNRVMWLYRNPMYGLQHALGTRVISAQSYHVKGNEKTGDKSQTGWVFRVVDTGFLPIFQFYGVWTWPKTSRCVRLHVGWKIWEKPQDGQSCMLVLSFTPWKTFFPAKS